MKIVGRCRRAAIEKPPHCVDVRREGETLGSSAERNELHLGVFPDEQAAARARVARVEAEAVLPTFVEREKPLLVDQISLLRVVAGLRARAPAVAGFAEASRRHGTEVPGPALLLRFD